MYELELITDDLSQKKKRDPFTALLTFLGPLGILDDPLSPF